MPALLTMKPALNALACVLAASKATTGLPEGLFLSGPVWASGELARQIANSPENANKIGRPHGSATRWTTGRTFERSTRRTAGRKIRQPAAASLMTPPRHLASENANKIGWARQDRPPTAKDWRRPAEAGSRPSGRRQKPGRAGPPAARSDQIGPRSDQTRRRRTDWAKDRPPVFCYGT